MDSEGGWRTGGWGNRNIAVCCWSRRVAMVTEKKRREGKRYLHLSHTRTHKRAHTHTHTHWGDRESIHVIQPIQPIQPIHVISSVI